MASINQFARRAFFITNTRHMGGTTAAIPGASGSGHGGYKKWKNLSLFVAFPAVGLAMVNAFVQHSSEERERPEFVPYEHMRIRTKRFPWGEGQRSLFHNPHVNPLPSGYED
ncbi:AAEL000929-PA [Aedes aegypti]|uniref:AAEL000929-PA n=1 Tax=Aedes aegypti TaxID=7159 RepID=Q17MY2_AEDAE|nr:AAEL000929-PA [Aedes aegypti]